MNAYCREGASEALSRNGTTGTREAWVSCSRIVGKTLMSSGLIDRIVAGLGRRLLEVPVGFKWFSAGLLDGSNHRRHRQGKLPGMEIYKYAGAHVYKNQSDGHDFVRLQNSPSNTMQIKWQLKPLDSVVDDLPHFVRDGLAERH